MPELTLGIYHEFVTRNEISQDEHGLSMNVARLINGLDALRIAYWDGRGSDLSSEQMQAMTNTVQRVYDIYFKPKSTHDEYSDDEYEPYEPMEREIGSVDKYLRNLWWQQYYEPRTRPAKREDFQQWLNEYVAARGAEVLPRVYRASSSFEVLYRPFRGEVTSDLRLATSDIVLIPGYGAKALGVMALSGITISRALSGAGDHHKILSSNYDDAGSLQGEIPVPNDVIVPSV